MTEPPADDRPATVMPRSAVVMVILLLLLPGGIFFAKGAVEVADRFAERTTHEATLLRTEIDERFNNRGRTETRYEVRGVTADGWYFVFDDRRVFELADGQTPLPVRVERSGLTGRVIAVRSDAGVLDAVGGATRLGLATLALALGALFAVVPLRLPWHTDARNKAREQGSPPPPPDWGAFALVSVAAVVIVGGTLAWDLMRVG